RFCGRHAPPRSASPISNTPVNNRSNQRRKEEMSNLKESLDQVMMIEGAMLVALVDSNSGMSLGHVGSGIDVDAATAGNTEVVRPKLKTMKALNLKDEIEDILISL